jgi:hypothetical protein
VTGMVTGLSLEELRYLEWPVEVCDEGIGYIYCARRDCPVPGCSNDDEEGVYCIEVAGFDDLLTARALIDGIRKHAMKADENTENQDRPGKAASGL